MSALADDAGFASALIYYYFGSKSGLYQSVVETSRSRLQERVIGPIAAVVAHQASLEARLTTLVSVLAHRGNADIGLHRLLLAGDLEAAIPEVRELRESIGADLQGLYWAVAGVGERGPRNDRERQLVAAIELLVLGVWLFGMRRHGVERLPIVVQAFMALLDGTLFEAHVFEVEVEDADEPPVAPGRLEATRASSDLPDGDVALQEHLASSALHLFASSGYGKTSLKEVAMSAGVTTGAIFHHFGSKAGLFRAAGTLGLDRWMDRSTDLVSSVDLRSERSQSERVKMYFRSISATVEDLIDNHWMGMRVNVDAELYPALMETRDAWAEALEQHYRLVAGEPPSSVVEVVSDQQPLLVLLDVFNLGAAWLAVRHGPEAVQSGLQGLERLIDRDV